MIISIREDDEYISTPLTIIQRWKILNTMKSNGILTSNDINILYKIKYRRLLILSSQNLCLEHDLIKIEIISENGGLRNDETI